QPFRQLPADRLRQLVAPGASGSGGGLRIDVRYDQPFAEQAGLRNRDAIGIEDGAVAVPQRALANAVLAHHVRAYDEDAEEGRQADVVVADADAVRVHGLDGDGIVVRAEDHLGALVGEHRGRLDERGVVADDAAEGDTAGLEDRQV